ncbi:MAG: methyltransferase domain-containing protein [Waddliaceae bacterium]
MDRVVAVIQARTRSTRLKQKVLLELVGKPILWHVIERAKRCQTVDAIVVATTDLDEDIPIRQLAGQCRVESFPGDAANVLDRFYQAAKKTGATLIVRITADCPLIHPPTVDEMVKLCKRENVDYVCLDPTSPTFEVGAEVMTFKALETTRQLAKTELQQEHVTLYIREHPDRFSIRLCPPSFTRGSIRLTVDEEADFLLMQDIYQRLYQENQVVDLKDVLRLLDENPELKEINAAVKPSEINQYATSETLRKKIAEAAAHHSQKPYVYPPTGTTHEGEAIDFKEGFTIINCKNCGFKHITPIPLPEELESFYQEDYYSIEKPKYIQEVEEDSEWWEMTYQEYYALFEKHLKTGTKRVLDIGSGLGYFLKCGQELGWTVMGIEPSKQAYTYSQQFSVNVVNDFLTKQLADTLGTFDVIFMDTVMEHLPDPISFLALTKHMLAEEGMVCVVSPNDYNPLQNIIREQLQLEPWWVVPTHHINYFDVHSMQSLLGKLAFDVVKTTSTFPMELFLLFGDNYVGDNQLGRACHTKRKCFEKNLCKGNPSLMRSLYRSFAQLGIGRKFVILARNQKRDGAACTCS